MVACTLAQEQQHMNRAVLCLNSKHYSRMFEYVLIWVLEVFTQEVLLLLFVFLKILCLNCQTVYLGSLLSICSHLECLLCQQRYETNFH